MANRKQRRQRAKLARKAVTKEQEEYNMLNKLAHKKVREAKDELWRENALDWYKIQLWIMHTRFGWAGKRLARLHEAMMKEFPCFQEGYINIDEVTEELKRLKIEIV